MQFYICQHATPYTQVYKYSVIIPCLIINTYVSLMYELKKKIGKIVTSKFVGTGPSSYKKKNLPGRGLTKFEKHCSKPF